MTEFAQLHVSQHNVTLRISKKIIYFFKTKFGKHWFERGGWKVCGLKEMESKSKKHCLNRVLVCRVASLFV